ERAESTGTGVDLSAQALEVAQENRDRHRLHTRATLLQGSWFHPVEQTFDLIVSNPPYIAADEMPHLAPEVREWEPHLALTPGGDGLDAYRAIAKGAGGHLTPQGRLLLEIGPTQGPAVTAILQAAGFSNVAVHPDLDGRDRVVAARMP
ncbi:MAG: N5-glutamine methyltransferase family protein, partial [Paracoccaceae bacterium]